MEVSRRTAIRMTSAAVLAAKSFPALAAPFAWQARHGLDANAFQATFDDLVHRGYRLVQVDGYNVAGTPRFAAIWNKTDGPRWIAHHNMTSDEYQQTFDQLTQQGYRPRDVSGYEAGGSARYATIWIRSSGPLFEARHGMTADQYQQTFNELTAKGYRLTRVSGYAVAGEPFFAAIFELASGPNWMARHGLDARHYQAEFDRAVAQGYRLRQVSGYSVNDRPYFAAIWDQGGGPPWQARHNLTSGEYQAAFDTFAQQGMRLVDVSGYGFRSDALYAALWVKG